MARFGAESTRAHFVPELHQRENFRFCVCDGFGLGQNVNTSWWWFRVSRTLWLSAEWSEEENVRVSLAKELLKGNRSEVAAALCIS